MKYLTAQDARKLASANPALDMDELMQHIEISANAGFRETMGHALSAEQETSLLNLGYSVSHKVTAKGTWIYTISW